MTNSSNSEIELVAFDLGNVLCTLDESGVSKTLAAISDKTPDEVHDIVFAKTHKLQFESGEQTFAEHAVRAIANLGIDMPLDEFTSLYDSVLIPSTEIFPLVSQIAEKHRIALVSNTSEPHWNSAKQFLPFSAELDPVIVSYAANTMKPDRAFYDQLLVHSGVPAQNILFVDDLAENIAGAEAIGMIGHIFESLSGLESTLAELGII
jgi:FMN phosphatase YigB (HAD superfamily)